MGTHVCFWYVITYIQENNTSVESTITMAHGDGLFSALKWEGDRFQQVYMNPITRLSRFLIRLLVLSFLHGFVALFETLLWLVRAMILLMVRLMLKCCQLAKAITHSTVVQPTIASTRFFIRITSAIISSWRGEERFVPVPSSNADSPVEHSKISSS